MSQYFNFTYKLAFFVDGMQYYNSGKRKTFDIIFGSLLQNMYNASQLFVFAGNAGLLNLSFWFCIPHYILSRSFMNA